MIAAAIAAVSTGLARFDHLLMLTFFPPFLWLLIANPPPVDIFPPERPWHSFLCVTFMIQFSFHSCVV
jgi:hypothetical protein